MHSGVPPLNPQEKAKKFKLQGNHVPRAIVKSCRFLGMIWAIRGEKVEIRVMRRLPRQQLGLDISYPYRRYVLFTGA